MYPLYYSIDKLYADMDNAFVKAQTVYVASNAAQAGSRAGDKGWVYPCVLCMSIQHESL